RASKERAKALNSESLYMTPLWFVIVLARIVTGEGLPPTHGPESSPILSPIGYPPTPSRQYVKIWASTGLWPRNCQPFVRASPLCAAFSSRALPDRLPLPPWSAAPGRPNAACTCGKDWDKPATAAGRFAHPGPDLTSQAKFAGTCNAHYAELGPPGIGCNPCR